MNLIYLIHLYINCAKQNDYRSLQASFPSTVYRNSKSLREGNTIVLTFIYSQLFVFKIIIPIKSTLI